MVAKFLRKRWDKNIGTFDIYISDRFSLDSKTRAKYCNSIVCFGSSVTGGYFVGTHTPTTCGDMHWRNRGKRAPKASHTNSP